MKAVAVLSVICLILAGGCARRQEAAQPAPAETPSPQQPRQAPARSITLETQRPAAQSTPAEVAVREARPVQQRDRLLSLRDATVHSPEDYQIGALQSYSDDRDVQLVLTAIRSFQEGLESESINVQVIHPDWQDQAQRSLGFHLERGHLPLEVRIGVVDIYADGKARANIRFVGDPGVAFGEIYLDKMRDSWLVSDLQVDLADLADAREESEDPYEPSVYRMMNLP